jgi:hypothetical protein
MGSVNGLTNEGQTQFFYNVTMPSLAVQSGGINTAGNLSVSRSAPTGDGNVTTSITNSGQDGFSSLYLQTTNQTINETGQLYVGQQNGLTLMTRTNHPIQFKAYSDQPLTTVPTSMKILSNTTRDVEIYTPLKIKSTTATVIDNGLVINGVLKVDEIRMTDTETLPSDGVMITAINGRELFKVSNTNTTSTENLVGLKNIEAVANLTVGGTSNFGNNTASISNTGQILGTSLGISGDVIIQGSLAVGGLLNTMSFYPMKPYASCLITTTGGTVSLFNYGYVNLTTANLTRVGTNNKAYMLTFPTVHPNGTNYAVMAVPYTSSSASWDSTLTNDYICTTKRESNNGMSVWCRRPGQAPAQGIIDGSFYVYTVP